MKRVSSAAAAGTTADTGGATVTSGEGGGPADSANLDAGGGSSNDDPDDDQPTTRKMPRAKHEIVTGPDEDDKIAAGTFITAKVAEQHGLDREAGERLLAKGAIELVDVQQA